jgi:hypothetical protein
MNRPKAPRGNTASKQKPEAKTKLRDGKYEAKKKKKQ